MIKVLLAEEHKIVRDGIRALLEKERDFEIVAEAENGAVALQLINDGCFPDIILSGIIMPEMNGMELALKLKDANPQIKVVILTMLLTVKCVFESMGNGAVGYLLKSTTHDELVFALKHVNKGFKYICAEMALSLVAQLKAVKGVKDSASFDCTQLSNRESEILLLISDGYTNSEIADNLFISRRTVEGHRQSILSKTNTKNTASLIKYAMRTHLIN